MCPADLALHNPGPIGHERWLTTGNRIMRPYVAITRPQEERITLVIFALRVYATRVLIIVKSKRLCLGGGTNLLQTVAKSSYSSLVSITPNIDGGYGVIGVARLIKKPVAEEVAHCLWFICPTYCCILPMSNFLMSTE